MNTDKSRVPDESHGVIFLKIVAISHFLHFFKRILTCFSKSVCYPLVLHAVVSEEWMHGAPLMDSKPFEQTYGDQSSCELIDFGRAESENKSHFQIRDVSESQWARLLVWFLLPFSFSSSCSTSFQTEITAGCETPFFTFTRGIF